MAGSVPRPSSENVALTTLAVVSPTSVHHPAVLANRADQYFYIPTLWAALVALLTPLAALLSGAWLDVWDVFVGANFVDETCVRASCGDFEKTESSLNVDLSGSYRLNGTVDLFARVENLTGEEDIVGRQPYGARPNKDTTASVGVRFDF